MKVEQRSYSQEKGWSNIDQKENFGLVLTFGSPDLIKKEDTFSSLKKFYPNADIVLVSTSGEIQENFVYDNTISVTALEFKKTKTKVFSESIKCAEDSFEVGKSLSEKLLGEDLKHILVFSDGLKVNGSQLVNGIESVVKETVSVSGGLAGDGANFKETFVSLNSSAKEGEAKIVLVGLYGNNIKVGTSSVGGWNDFGIERKVTKSKNNVVYELDNEPILDLYKNYLGKRADELPGSGLYFPLKVYKDDKENSIVRTLLGINEEEKSITFAGDIPEGYTAYLMKNNFDDIIDGAGKAAEISKYGIDEVEFALLVSCVGRKIILGQRIEQEIEGVREIVGDSCFISGFYSYGEIGANKDIKGCELHNQTMTVTLFSEE